MFNINGRAARWAKGLLMLGGQVIGYLVFNSLFKRADAEEIWTDQNDTALIPVAERFNPMLRSTYAQCVPGDEFRVNTNTTNGQYDSSVAGLGDGGYVVTWHGDQTGNYDVYAQQYSSIGTKVGEEFRVNSATTDYQSDSSVAGLGDGGYVVTWYGYQTGDTDIYAQQYSSIGTKVGEEFRVNNATTDYQYHPSVAGLGDGGYVVTWYDCQTGDTDIYAQQYSSIGTKVGEEFRVNSATTDYQYSPSVAGLGDGGYVVTWNGDQTGNYDVYAQQYSSIGTKVGEEFRVNSATTGSQYYPSVAGLGDGGYVVTWRGDQTGNYDVYAQQYSSIGTKVGEEFRVDSATTGDQYSPSVAGLGDGGYVVTWYGYQTGDADIYAQQYSSIGTKVGEEFRVNSATTDYQYYPSVAGLGDGGYVVTWYGYQTGDADIYARQYTCTFAESSSQASSSSYPFSSSNSTSSSQASSSHQTTPSSSSQPPAVTSSSSDQTNPPAPFGLTPIIISASGGAVGLICIAGVVICFVGGGMYVMKRRRNSKMLEKHPDEEKAMPTYPRSDLTPPASQELQETASMTPNKITSSKEAKAEEDKRATQEMEAELLDRKQRVQNTKKELQEREESFMLKQGKDTRPIDMASNQVKPSRGLDIQPPVQQIETESSSEDENEDEPVAAYVSISISYASLTLGKELGRGGFGVVYKGEWQHGQVAIKQLINRNITPKALDEFKNEVSIMAGINHSNIVQCYGACFEAGRYSIVMEYMPKGSLCDVLHSSQSLPWKVRYSIAMDITSGLSVLHARNILHRDLKSLNVLLDDHMRAKLTDFGLSKIKTETQSQSVAQQSQGGTVAWKAPELCKRGVKATKASDVYSYGMILWELTSRKFPFSNAANPVVISQWVAAGEQEKIPEEWEDQNPKYSALIKWCWSLKPEDRPTIDEAAEQLKSHPIDSMDEGEITSSDEDESDGFSDDESEFSEESIDSLSAQSSDLDTEDPKRAPRFSR